MVTRASLWLVHRAADRWPAAIRGELLREWTAEIRTIARDRSLSTFRRARLMLGFGISLALARPGGEPTLPPLGWKRITGVVAAVVGYLLVLALADQGWRTVYQSMAEGERPIIDDSNLGARLVQGAVALIPVLLAAVTGWWLGRRFAARRVRPTTLGLCLIAVVAGWVGLGFGLERLALYNEMPNGVPYPSTMAYHFGNQPYGMVTSWAVWLVAFVLFAAKLRSVAGRRTGWRLVTASVTATLIAALAVTAATFVQFGSSTAPRSQAWKWFAQWLVPPQPFESATDEGAHSFHSARGIWSFLSSYPHVLLAVAAFGVAFLMANNRQAVLANGLGIESSSSRV
ncbi:hypothetical protein [Virgisporangium aurantiacum]|uniref:Uncharacterized protein n=1 Tax=Virgisporangium aurantiacum TaxID=175570 RepID=A0A8J4E8F4_9ACTN|nr:hypothetical protein [Virgisporangium aurantiacum]GIJ62742.1 hypothetical protein Vau01_102580 [Virgisporangium aurantiacum]